MKFDYIMLIIFEFYTVMFVYLVIIEGSSYERGGANVYLLIFGYVMGIGVVILNDLHIIRILLLVLRMAKLPVYRLHIWLPKVHVEASIVGSIVLAGGVLKLGILYYWNFGGLMMIRVLILFSSYYLISIVDGKRFAAYSSVLHMTICVIVRLVVILLVRYIHIVISPLIFITVYIRYVMSGSRIYIKLGVIIIILWLVNFGLPFLGGFFAEVYIIINNGSMLLILLLIYIMVGYVIMKGLNNNTNSRLIYLPFLVLYLLII